MIKREGFTSIELMLVVGLLGIIMFLSVSFYGKFLADNAAANAADQIIGSARKAQIYAMSGKADSAWGIAYATSTRILYLFKGQNFASRDESRDETFSVPNSVQITGLSEVVFSKIYGYPNATTTVVLVRNNTSTNIGINSQGIIQKE